MKITMLRNLGGRADRVEGQTYEVTTEEGEALIARKLAYDTDAPGDNAPLVVKLPPPQYVWDLSDPHYAGVPHPPGVETPK